MVVLNRSRGRISAGLWLLSAAACSVSGGEGEADPHPAPPRPPNVVVFFIDDLGYADVEPFGAPTGSTPAIARLAREGVVQRNFHVSQPVCSASRASLLTGCYANRVDVNGAFMPWDAAGLRPEETTIAELLRERGYATALFGKWHLGHCAPEFLPTRQGFDVYFGLPYSNDMWPPNGKRRFPPLPLFEQETIVDDDVDAADQATLTARCTERAVDFIKKKAGAGPFYVQLNHTMVHVPIFASPAFVGRTGRGVYADVVAEIDASVGAVLEALDQTGVADDTLVIFKSDNGPWLPFGDHAGAKGVFREGKGTTWEGGVRVPCVVRYPRAARPGTVSDAMLMTIDVLPTVAALAGAAPPALPIDGRNRPAAFFRGEPTDAPPGYAYYYGRSRLHAVVDGLGRFKLVFPHSYPSLQGRPPGVGGARTNETSVKFETTALYDLLNDPAETHDVAAKHPEVVAALSAYADRMRAELGDASRDQAGTATRPSARAAVVPPRFKAP